MTETQSQDLAGDVAALRRAVAAGRAAQHLEVPAWLGRKAYLGLHCVLAVLATGFALVEFATENANSDLLFQSAHSAPLRSMGILSIGVGTVLLVGCVYFIIWRSSRYASLPYRTYIRTSFRYLSGLAFLSDIALKFLVVAMLLEAGRPHWLAPLFLFYTADFLFQQRIFLVEPLLSLLSSIALIGIGVTQLVLGSGALVVPAAAVAVISVMSIYSVCYPRNRE